MLKREGYRSEVSDTLSNASVVMASLKPGVVLHNWDAFDPTQSVQFQLQCARTLDYTDICRVLYAADMTPQVLSTVADYGVFRVLPHDCANVQLISEIRKAHVATRHLSHLRALVLSYQVGKDYDQTAIDQAVRKAFEMYPRDPITRIEFGNLRVRQGQVDEALAQAKSILDDEPANVRAMNLLGRCHLAKGEVDAALAVLGKANVLSPFNGERLLLLGRAFLDSGNLATGSAKIGEAVRADSQVKDEAKRVGMMKLEAGEIGAAAEIFSVSLSEDEAVSLLNNAAVIAVKKPDILLAIDLFELALKAARSNTLRSIVLYNLGLNQIRVKRNEDAQRNFELAVQLDGKNEKARRQLTKMR